MWHFWTLHTGCILTFFRRLWNRGLDCGVYWRMPVCAGLVWNKDQDELFTKYLEQMDEYTGVWKLKNAIRKVSAWLFLGDRGKWDIYTSLSYSSPFPKGAKRYSTSVKDCSYVKEECLFTVSSCKAQLFKTLCQYKSRILVSDSFPYTSSFTCFIAKL